jgi:hypothetical protein
MKAITTKYHPYTNTKPAQISASDKDGNRVYMSVSSYEGKANETFDAEYDMHLKAACKLVDKMKWVGSRLVGGGIKGGYAFVFAD